MGYFNYIPNVAVPSFLSEKKASNEYIVAKNIFRKIKILDELEDNILLFDKYEIYQGDRPDTVAKDLYGNSELDFVVILSANITNIRNQWPLSEYDLYNYSHDKYGSEINADIIWTTYDNIIETYKKLNILYAPANCHC